MATTTTLAARFWGLQINQSTPDFGAIEQLLKVRYHHRDDDVDDVPLFAGR